MPAGRRMAYATPRRSNASYVARSLMLSARCRVVTRYERSSASIATPVATVSAPVHVRRRGEELPADVSQVLHAEALKRTATSRPQRRQG